MLLKDNILLDIKGIDSPKTLRQISDYIQVVKQAESNITPNHDAVIKFAGLLNDSEAEKISTLVSKEFNRIEGEW